MIFSYSISGEILLVEKNRANLNILTGLNAITHTAEGNYEKIEEILQKYKPDNLFVEILKTIFLKIKIFLKTFNFLFLTFIIFSYIRKNKLTRIYLILVILIFLTHLPFSVEKRYLFPCGIIMIIGISILISKNEEDNHNISKKLFNILAIPTIIVSSIILIYSVYKPKKDYCKQFKSYNLVKAIKNLYYFRKDNAIPLLKKYTKGNKYLYTDHINDIISIIEEDPPYNPKYTSLIFNSDFLIFLKLISLEKLTEAQIYIEKNWKNISSSYIRKPLTKREEEINLELESYIKENFMTLPTFAIISSNIDEMTNLCKKANNIISKISKKHKFNCKQIAIQNIRGKCINKNYNFSLSKVIEEIVKLERQKKYDEALKIIENNINKIEFYKFYVEKANILYLQNKFEQAEKNYLKAIELCPCAPDAIYGIKSIYKKKKINYKPHPECSFLKF
ncbi:MAG: tetratricopeptide repeat protein [Elusimicrobiales bacterium]|nr:tetratricopeptide repeat protein [Elusimicrobiales bacterium]